MKYGKMRRTCEQCHFIHFYDPVVAAVVFAVQDNCLLMIRRAVNPEKGKWALPAGYIDYDEAPYEAAAREVLEETGLEVRITRVIDVLGRDTSTGAKASIVILFEGEIIGGEPSAQDDASEVAFFAPNEIPVDDIASFKSLDLLLERWKSAS
ncbi:MAG: NUDIX domain-containing protein [Anaerolineae bacterium]|nr:NUDIX domain-containing protein [Anaerolineae bacterium]